MFAAMDCYQLNGNQGRIGLSKLYKNTVYQSSMKISCIFKVQDKHKILRKTSKNREVHFNLIIQAHVLSVSNYDRKALTLVGLIYSCIWVQVFIQNQVKLNKVKYFLGIVILLKKSMLLCPRSQTNIVMLFIFY